MSNLQLQSKFLSLCQSEDGTKLFGKILVCPLDEGNLNGKGIKKSDLSEDELKTLIEQPVVAKVIKNHDGEWDFSGHEMKKIKVVNKTTGKIETKVEFGTNPIGFFTSSEIEDIEIDGVIKPCIVANVVFWTRYEQAIEVILRLFDEGNLSVSYELTYSESYKEDDVTWLKGIIFIGVAVLGSNVTPAYPIAGVIELSELDEDDCKLAIAFTNDLLTLSKQDKDNINIKKGGREGMPNEISSITNNDLYSRVQKAINATSSDKWYYIAMLYPYEYRVVAYEWDRVAEEDYIEFTYVVNSDETISIASQKDVKMVFVPKETIETQIAEKDSEIEKLNKDLSEKIEALTKAGESLTAKENEIAELLPYKEKVVLAEQEAAKVKLEKKKEALKTLATKGNYITLEEIETSEEIKSLIDNLDEKGIKAIIAERVIAKIEASEKEENKEIEVSTANEKVPKLNIESKTNGEIDPLDIMSKFLNK